MIIDGNYDIFFHGQLRVGSAVSYCRKKERYVEIHFLIDKCFENTFDEYNSLILGIECDDMCFVKIDKHYHFDSGYLIEDSNWTKLVE